MKIAQGVANLFLVMLIIMQININFNQVEIANRNLESNRLATAIDNSSKFAFANALKVSNLDQEYDDLSSFTVDPTNILDDFAFMMARCYGLAPTKENYDMILTSIDGAIICDNNGYYVLEAQDIPYGNNIDKPNSYTANFYDNRDTLVAGGNANNLPPTQQSIARGVTKKDLKWSLKLPYYFEHGNEHFALSLTNANTVVLRGTLNGVVRVARNKGVVETKPEKVTYQHDGQTYTVDHMKKTGHYKDFSGTVLPQDVLNDDIKTRLVNIQLSNELNKSIDEITQVRGRKRAYTVYLPTETTTKGLNPVQNSSLLVAMSEAPFAPKARLVKPSLSGYTAVTKQYIVGFRDKESGQLEYCYAQQLPKEITEDEASKLETFYSMTEAAKAGYVPSLKYITRPLIR